MTNYTSFCEYFYDNYYSIITSCITTIIGAALGFIFALTVYWIGEWTKRTNEKHAEKLKAFNTLKRFSVLILSVKDKCQKQNDEFDLFSNELTANPLILNLPQVIATNDRERLVESDSIELYYSFMIFDKQNKNKFKEYKNIFNYADFLQKFYSDLISQNEKHLNFSHSDSKVVRDKLLNIAVKIGLLQKDIQMNNPKGFTDDLEFQFLERFRQIYVGLKGNGFSDLEPYKDTFLIPLQIELFENINDQKIANEIASESATAITRLDELILNAKDHAKQYLKINENKNVTEALEYLEKIRIKIEAIVEP